MQDLLANGVAGNDLSPYPWYRSLGQVPLPRWNDRDALELDAHLVARASAEAGVAYLAYPFRVVDVSSFNSLIRRHENKSLALFDATASVLKACLVEAHAQRQTEFPDAACTLVIDRHGARSRYRDLLQRTLPQAEITVRSERAHVSRYRVGEHTDILFAEKGETRAFPTAAGSCLAKYLRELLIEQLNAWFVARQPDLKPTAGYYSDGRRFLDEIENLNEIPQELLVRNR